MAVGANQDRRWVTQFEFVGKILIANQVYRELQVYFAISKGTGEWPDVNLTGPADNYGERDPWELVYAVFNTPYSTIGFAPCLL